MLHFIALAIVFFGFSTYFIFSIKKRKKIQKESEKPIPQYWKKLLENHVHFYRDLDNDKKSDFQERIMYFLAHVKVIGVGTQVDDLDRILVASGAVIPIFGFPKWQYTKLREVLLYPSAFNPMLSFNQGDKDRRILGIVGNNGALDSVMILSKPSLHNDFSNNKDKQNVAIHEFLHLIDKEDYNIDGVPQVLLDRSYSGVWIEYIRKNIEAIDRNESDIRKYAATSASEFFAVVGEYFFEQPEQLKLKHPKLYDILTTMFHQDLAHKKM